MDAKLAAPFCLKKQNNHSLYYYRSYLRDSKIRVFQVVLLSFVIFIIEMMLVNCIDGHLVWLRRKICTL